MKIRFAILLLAACLATSARADNLNTESTLADEGIEPGPTPATILDGIPLMEGLQLNPDKDLIKVLPDRPSPTVIAVGIIDVDSIYNFYKRTMPPLGWQATSGRDYAKGNESLHINAHADGKLSTVTFTEATAN